MLPFLSVERIRFNQEVGIDQGDGSESDPHVCTSGSGYSKTKAPVPDPTMFFGRARHVSYFC